ncbi:MAG: type secretion system protein PorQ [Bacteroidota bacterium]|jgi:hypothetical protein
MKKKTLLILVLALCASLGRAQEGGRYVFSYLSYGLGGRVAAVAGRDISPIEAQSSSSWHNPATTDTLNARIVEFSYYNYFAGIQRFTAHYTLQTRVGAIALHAVHFGYGEFQGRDSYDNPTGSFSATDNAVAAAWAKPLSDSSIRIGISVKALLSSYEQYSSFAMSSDIGLYWQSPDSKLAAGLVFRNLGYQIKPFTETSRSSLPWGIDIGISKKLEHAPFRINLNLVDLQTWNLGFDATETQSPTQGATAGSSYPWYREFILHTAFGLEFTPSRNFRLMASYNPRIRNELKETTLGGASGFAFGLAFSSRKFQFSFNQLFYHSSSGIQGITASYKF